VWLKIQDSHKCSGKITEKASWTEQFPANLLTGAKHLQPSQPITWLILTKLNTTTTQKPKRSCKKNYQHIHKQEELKLKPGLGRGPCMQSSHKMDQVSSRAARVPHGVNYDRQTYIVFPLVVLRLGRGINDEVWEHVNAVHQIILIHRLTPNPLHSDGRCLGTQHHHQGLDWRNRHVLAIAAAVTMTTTSTINILTSFVCFSFVC